MTTELGAIGLTYDGVDLQPADLGYHLYLVSGLDDSPDVRGEDVTIPYLAGRLARPRRFDHRRIILEGFARGLGSDQATSRADYRAVRRGLAELFDPAREIADLVATLEDGSVATIAARPLSLVGIEAIPSEYAALSVELEAIEDWSVEVAGS